MIEIAMVKTIVDISKTLIDIAPAFSSREQREAVAEWMMEIGELLGDVASQLAEDDFPYAVCAKMKVYAEKFPEVVGDFMEKKDMQQVHKLLLEAQNLEAVYGQLQGLSKKDKHKCIAGIKTAAGTIIAHASLMRLGH